MRIKELRRRYGLSQAEFAQCLGLTQTAVSNWESGLRTPSLKMLHEIADYFGVSVDYIAGKEDSMMFNNDMLIIQVADAMTKLEDEDKLKPTFPEYHTSFTTLNTRKAL